MRAPDADAGAGGASVDAAHGRRHIAGIGRVHFAEHGHSIGFGGIGDARMAALVPLVLA
jgi:hypothetical protein